MTENQMGTLSRILCLLFVIASYFIANSDTPILEMMSYSWGIISGSFLAPYALALYCKKLNRTGAWCGMLGGFCVAVMPVIAKLFIHEWQAPFGLGAMMNQGPLFACLAMAVSLVLCSVGSAVARKAKLPGAAENEAFYGTAES